MKERVAIVDGVRTPFCKSGGPFQGWEADDLGAFAVRELLDRIPLTPGEIDELIFGNVIQPPHAANMARVVAVKGGLPVHVPAFTVNRNCASGLEAVVSAANKIRQGEADAVIAGGTESMSRFPVLFPDKMRDFLVRISKAKRWQDKLKLLTTFRPSFLSPKIPGLNDPLCSLSMGQTAEVIAAELHVSREEQDLFSLESHRRAALAKREGKFAAEIFAVPSQPGLQMQEQDDGIRDNATIEALRQLPTVFDRLTGTVTAGSSSQVTDGAAALLLMSENSAKERGLKPLGYIRDATAAALDPSRMGLGPVFAITKLLRQTGVKLEDFDLIEINEAFAAQVLAVTKALGSRTFFEKHFDGATPAGKIDPQKLNVNGGAIAIGHPVGASGARLVLTILRELKRRNQNLGLVSLCIGGGQGQAAILEVY